MKQGVNEGRYFLEFKVYDRKHAQSDVPANISVVVKEISHEAVINSGSVRIVGISDEDFIRTWNWDAETQMPSLAERFRDNLAKIMSVNVENVDVFSVMQHRKESMTTDVRFFVHGSSYIKPAKLNGLLLQHKEEFERDLEINITMVGIDECLHKMSNCEVSCTSSLEISSLPYMVNANRTSLVGVRVLAEGVED